MLLWVLLTTYLVGLTSTTVMYAAFGTGKLNKMDLLLWPWAWFRDSFLNNG